jgi:predicted amidohydrolase
MAPPDTLRAAVVQPRVLLDGPPGANTAEAAEAVALAGAEGARLVLFPEAYPGPLRAGDPDAPGPVLAEAARRAGAYVVWGRVEAGSDSLWRVMSEVIGPDGAVFACTARTHPATGDVHRVLSGTAVAPGAELATVPVDGVPVGLLTCSELWLPEVARILALRGAEVILAPAGGGLGAVAENWRLVARVRAIENECHVLLTQGRYRGEPGCALIAGPEGVVAASEDRTVVVADLDLARARWLRERDDSMEDPKPFRSLPGLLRARRPELYAELAQPREGLYDYAGAALEGAAR